MARKDLLTRLADAGEEAIGKLGDAPGMERMLGFANSTRDRLDELTRRVRGLEELERRVVRLEERLGEQEGLHEEPGASPRGTAASATEAPEGEPEDASAGAIGGDLPGEPPTGRAP